METFMDKPTPISVIIPLGCLNPEFHQCLEAIEQSSVKPDEIIIVDDSKEGTIAEKLGGKYKVVRSTMPGGVSSARNTGAFQAKNELILFIDSDIIVYKDTIGKIIKTFSNEDIDAIVGIQSLDFPIKNFSSQYKNLWMNHTYTKMPDFVPLFYTSCAAIKKSLFLESGGFDRNYRSPSLEDTVFGRKLDRLGIKVKLARDIDVIHLKKYNLRKLLLTDF
jgi:GT2 family glycosyltransferase